MFIISKLIDKRIEAYQARLAQVHFAEVENMYGQMRMFGHDFRNHIQTLRVLAGEGSTDELIAYLDNLDDSLNDISPVLRMGNKMCDAILSSKISLARSKDIHVNADVNIPIKINVPPLDLCIIFGNLMDNAIDACLKLPIDERRIRLYVDLKSGSGQMYISITNATASKKQTMENGRVKTTKGDGHGFGLLSIDNIVARHGGYLSSNSEDGAFSTEIILPL